MFTRPLLRLLAVVAAVLVITLASVVVWDRNFRHASSNNPSMNCPAVVHAKHGNPLAAFGVHHVTLIGDSIMWQPSCAIAESLAGIGIDTSRDAISGTGLLTGTADWIARMPLLLKAEHPDIVVAIFVGNYPLPPVVDKHGAPIFVDTPAWYAAWQQRAQKLSDEVRAAGAQMYWVSPPPIDISILSHAARLFDGYRKIKGDHFLTSGSALAGPNGREVPTKETCGKKRVVRSTIDGVHLSDDGARIYGEQIAHDLSARLGILTAPQPC